MKAYPNIEQCEKLAKILPIESADMGWYYSHNPEAVRTQMWVGTKADNADIPCWSLVALLAAIPIEHNLHGYLTENGMVYRVETLYAGNSKSYDNPIDACVDMIVKLHEQNIL